MAISWSAIRKFLGKLTDLLNKGREKALWDKGLGPRLVIVALSLWGISCAYIPPCVRYLADGTINQHPECIPSPAPSPSPCPEGQVRDTLHGQDAGCIPWPPASPSPAPSPTPAPSPSPVASPSPVPSASPAPSPSPVSGELCPKPIRVKLALFSKRKLEESRHTWRNVWNVTPIVPSTGPGGSCEWKRNQESGELPEECEAANSCAQVYAVTFAPVDPAVGIPQAYQAGHNKDGSTFSHDPVERSSTSDYLLVITDAGQGPAKLCASFPNLTAWRCQQFFVDSEGEAIGVEGNDRDKSFDEAK